MSVGADVGGTFTDLVRWDRGRFVVAKVSTTSDQSEGVAEGTAGLLGGGKAPVLVHGTTVATNALLEGRGARTVLVAEEGFEDVIEIGRQARPSLYDVMVDRAEPLVGRRDRVGWAEGESTDDVADRVAELRPESVALSFRYSFLDRRNEEEVAHSLERRLPGVPVSSSSRVAPEFREYERTSTTVINAYLRPTVEAYLRRLKGRLVPRLAARLLVMRSSGGVMPAEAAAELAAAVLLSGPAGGVVAAAGLGEILGRHRVISFDMGGTSTDVCRIEGGRPEVTYERVVQGRVCRLPSVAVHTVGAGGGSVGWIDAGGALRVGPRSAGAHPGPACYGRGGEEPTVTDADLVLGRLDGRMLLAGSVPVSTPAASAALERLGARLGLSVPETAEGIVEVVEAQMERAVRAVSVEEGADPRRAVLMAFGGAGGLHATSLARRLEMAGVVVPPFAGVFSAVGLLLSPPRHDVARSLVVTEGDAGSLDLALEEVAAEAAAALRAFMGAGPARSETLVDVRYLGQSHETTVPYRPGEGWATLGERFHAAHRERNGFARPGDAIEVVTVRAAAVGRPAAAWADLPGHEPSGEPRRGRRQLLTRAGPQEAEVWWRPGMRPGAEVVGPAIVEEGEATVYLAPGERGRLHPSGALEVEW